MRAPIEFTAMDDGRGASAGRRRGGGVKCEERIAFDTCPPGMQFVIPKSSGVPRGSINAWRYYVGKERGVHFSEATTDDGLVISVWSLDAWEEEKRSWGRAPAPKKKKGSGAPSKYPFSGMVIGDYVVFEDAPGGSQSRPAMAARMHGRCHGSRFKVRTIENNGIVGCRIWRTA